MMATIAIIVPQRTLTTVIKAIGSRASRSHMCILPANCFGYEMTNSPLPHSPPVLHSFSLGRFLEYGHRCRIGPVGPSRWMTPTPGERSESGGMVRDHAPARRDPLPSCAAPSAYFVRGSFPSPTELG